MHIFQTDKSSAEITRPWWTHIIHSSTVFSWDTTSTYALHACWIVSLYQTDATISWRLPLFSLNSFLFLLNLHQLILYNVTAARHFKTLLMDLMLKLTAISYSKFITIMLLND